MVLEVPPVLRMIHVHRWCTKELVDLQATLFGGPFPGAGSIRAHSSKAFDCYTTESAWGTQARPMKPQKPRVSNALPFGTRASLISITNCPARTPSPAPKHEIRRQRPSFLASLSDPHHPMCTLGKGHVSDAAAAASAIPIPRTSSATSGHGTQGKRGSMSCRRIQGATLDEPDARHAFSSMWAGVNC
jgi:hypothetical protein